METAAHTLGTGGPLTFDDFFEREHLRLGRAIYLLTGDAAEAEELIQEAFARVFERWDRVGRMDEPAGYVYRIAANLHRSRWRRAVRRSRADATPTSAEDPADAAAARQDVWAALATLTEQQRGAIVLVEFLGFDSTTAAKMLGIAASSMRVRLHRARNALRDELGGDDD